MAHRIDHLRCDRLHRAPRGRAARRPGRRADAGRALGGLGARAGRAARARVAGGRRAAPELGLRAARARRRAGSTVGPFVKWGEPAVRAAIAAKGVYIDSTGEPPFIRRIFEEFGPPAERAGATLLTAMGYDFVPGALAGALALEQAGAAAIRVDVGYYAFGAGISAGTRRSAVGIMFEDGYAFRDGRAADGADRRAGALVPRQGQGPRRDLGRRRRALHAAARPSRPDRGQRLSRLVPRSGASAAGGQPGGLGGDAPARRARGAEGRRRPRRRGRRQRPRPAGVGDLVGRRRGLRRRRQPARRGAPVGRRAVRAHRRHPRLGRAPRRRATASTAPGRSGRCRRSGCARSRRAAARRASTASATPAAV